MASSSPICLKSSDNSPMMSVLELTKKPLTTVPQQFVRDDREPTVAVDYSSPEFPTIDLNRLITEHTSHTELQKLHLACQNWGFFQLVNHGVNPSLLENLKNEVEAFFNLPLEEKVKYKIRPGDHEGYGTGIRTTNEKVDWGDGMYFLTNPIHKRKPHLFPHLPSSLRTTLELYLSESETVARMVFGYLGKALKIDEKMEEVFEDGRRAVRMSCYPRCPEPDRVHGIAPHSDATGITILRQLNGVDGLEIKKDGVWIPVHFLPDALVVNIGDTLEIMSNGVYKSIEHRAVVNSRKERMSITVFINPKFEADIGPFASLINPQNPPLFKTVIMENYVKEFIANRDKHIGKSFLEHMRIQNDEKCT